MAAADYRLMTEATGQRIAAALEALSGTGAAAAAARANLDVYSTGETDELIAQSAAFMTAARPTTADALDTVVNDMDANTLRFTPCGAYNGVVADLTGTTGLADWFVLTFKYSSALAFQFEFRGGNSSANRHIYVRQYNNGTWSAVTTLV